MPRTPAQAKSLEDKALSAENKSEGMRMLFEAGYEVSAVRTLFEVPYGFAYGVAKRGGFITPEPRAAKPASKATKASAAKPAPRAKATPARKTTARRAAAKA